MEELGPVTRSVIVAGIVALLIALSLLAPKPSAWRAWPPLAKKLARLRRPWVLRMGQRFRERRRTRHAYAWLLTLAIVGCVLVFVVWVGPSLLTRQPSIVAAADRHRAMSDVRTGLTAALVAIGAGASIAYTARTYRLTRTGQVTDRYTKAVAQLGDAQVEVRLGGIYALERLMKDSAEDAPTVVEVLAAFVRERAPMSAFTASGHDGSADAVRPSADVQAAVTVLGRREERPSDPRVDLRHTDLRGIELLRARLNRADMSGACLREADLAGIHLQDALLFNTDLRDANLSNAHLEGAHLGKASLERAVLQGGHFVRAILSEARLDGAFLARINCRGAFMDEANLQGVDMLGGDFQDASLRNVSFVGAPLVLADFSGASLTGVDFSGVNLKGCRFTRAEVEGALFEGAIMYRRSLTEQQQEQAGTSAERIHWE
jgi:uncharacterized protein YjbI with pentapeptide repeats